MRLTSHALLAFGKRALTAVADFVFGFDYFISYKHADGERYPQALADRLTTLGYAVFLDTRVYAPGDDLSTATRRRVRMSSNLVVLGRPGALTDSPWVLREVREAEAAGRVLVLVNFGRSLGRLQPTAEPQAARLDEFRRLFESRLRIVEQPEIADPLHMDGVPADATLQALQRSLTAVRQDTRRARAFGAAALLFVVLLAFASVQLYRALVAERAAERQARNARSGQLAALAELRRSEQPLTAAHLGIEAVETTLLRGEPTPALARQSVMRSLTEIGGDVLLPSSSHPLSGFDVSGDGRWLAGEDARGSVFVWDLAASAQAPTRIATRISVGKDDGGLDFKRLRGFDDNTLVIWNDAGCPRQPVGSFPDCIALATRSDVRVYEPESISLARSPYRAIAAADAVWLWTDTDGDRLLTPTRISGQLYTARHAILSNSGGSVGAGVAVGPGGAMGHYRPGTVHCPGGATASASSAAGAHDFRAGPRSVCVGRRRVRRLRLDLRAARIHWHTSSVTAIRRIPAGLVCERRRPHCGAIRGS